MERVIMQLLAKNPAERFPNTQVLARHLQAMVKALSRPAADDFALASEPHVADPLDAVPDHTQDVDATQLEVPRNRPNTPRGEIESKSHLDRNAFDVATLAADEETSGHPLTVDAVRQAQAGSSFTTPRPTIPAGHFTTVEQEEERRRAEGQRSWLAIASQLAALVALLGGMGAVAMHLSQPPSADDLYRTIVKRGITADDASVANVEREIEEFLRRFPADSRALELTKYRDRLALDKAERRLQRDARGGNAHAQLLPAERLYVQAIGLAETAPDMAIMRLQSLADLYGPDVSASNDNGGPEAQNDTHEVSGTDARVAIAVQLAQRKLAQLRDDLAKQHEAQLAALHERLDTAQRLAESDSKRSAAMYQAIIDLHHRDAWAAEVVTTARERLAELQGP
jgi:hypothetical protein